MFDYSKLTSAAKAEAFRYGHSFMGNMKEVGAMIEEISPYFSDGEGVTVKPLGSELYSVQFISTVRLKNVK